jgi:hypothetical protein
MVVRMIVHTFVWYGVIGLMLFFAAGTVDWPAAWIFLAVMIVLSLVGGLWLVRQAGSRFHAGMSNVRAPARQHKRASHGPHRSTDPWEGHDAVCRSDL